MDIFEIQFELAQLLSDTSQGFHMEYSNELKQLCFRLDESALPQAILDFNRRCFVAWNKNFLKSTGYSDDEIRILAPTEVIVLGRSKFPLPVSDVYPPGDFITCAVKKTLGPPAAPGHLVKTSGGLGYLMLEPTEAFISTEFEQGRLVGHEEERMRIVKMFHDEVSSPLMGSLFAFEVARSELESQGLPQAAKLARASELLTEASQKIRKALAIEKNEAGQ